MRTASTGPTPQERELLEAAGGGDEDAFARLVEPHRRELHAHCYRMLGSVHDAEDALQETLLRAWRAIGRFEGRSSLRSWLYTIATNTCLNAIEKRPKRVLPIDYGPSVDPHSTPGEPLVESVWVEPYPDEELAVEDGFAAPDARYELRESVELAFVAALQLLPANQRAALILREVLGFSAREVAEALDTTVASVNSALQRARESVDQRLPEQSQQATLRALGDEELTDLVESFMDAMARHDVAAVVELLAEDAAWSMPPMSTWFHGRRGDHRLPDRVAALGRVALAPPAGARERAGGFRRIHVVRGVRELPPVRAQRAHVPRRQGLGHHVVHHTPGAGARAPRPGALAGRADRPAPRHLRALRPARRDPRVDKTSRRETPWDSRSSISRSWGRTATS